MDFAASNGFDGITQMLLEQKKLMSALEAENRQLKRQLADLRRGIGISVVIEGRTLPVHEELSPEVLDDESSKEEQRNALHTPFAVVHPHTDQHQTVASSWMNGGKRAYSIADSFVL